MKWDDAEEVAILLEETYPDQDIFALRFTELRDLVRLLPGFTDDEGSCNEGVLEAIQMAWHEERESR
ncbi:protein IscX [Anaplasma platys]|uniref:Protein IscX n=1 Tax=Anaplasma platys TaxID=949 RepID=A0A858PYX1_9RICK|nr:Fe-S cluster assembly protein IscX [Anaplasma platys]QJC27762.1 protein IscX [Anaplasma platys]